MGIIMASAHDMGMMLGAEIGDERIAQGIIRHLVELAQERALHNNTSRQDELTDFADAMTGDVAGLTPADCDALDAAMVEHGIDPEERAVVQRAAARGADAVVRAAIMAEVAR